MNNPIAGFGALIGRTLICAIFFLSAAFYKIPKFSHVVEHMTKEGVPLPQFALVLTIAMLLVGSILIIVGFKARIGALLLFVFLAAATFYFPDFWNMNEEDAHVRQIMFMKNLSMLGTMVFIMAVGAGPWSIDNCCCKTEASETDAAV